MIYLDNAATSFPKPPQVAEAIVDLLAHRGGNPGRSGHALAVAAQAAVADTRRLLASFFGARDPSRVAFALNALIVGNPETGASMFAAVVFGSIAFEVLSLVVHPPEEEP